MELFKAIDCWAEKECEKLGLVAEGSVKRRVLGERVVQGIRFPVMEEREFADIVLDSEILTPRETNRLFKYFNSVLNDPVGFPDAKRAGYKLEVSRFKSLGRGWGSHYPDYIRFEVDKDIRLHAIELFGSDNSEYSVTLEVFDHNSGETVRSQEGIFLSKQINCEIGDHQGFDIVFVPSIAIKANRWYQISATITGPRSWYGTNGCSTVEHSGVTFHFYFVQKPTGCGKGQFSKFVFTLD